MRSESAVAANWSRAEIQSEFHDCADLKDIVARLEREGAERGEVICEIHVNGLRLSEADESRFAGSPLSELAELSIVSEPADLLVRDSARAAAEFSPRLNEFCLATADVVRDAGLPAAAKAFAQIVDGCRWAAETLEHARRASAAMGRPFSGEARWAAIDKSLSAAIAELLPAFERRDGALVADLLEYEIASVAASWAEAVAAEPVANVGGSSSR